MRASLRAVVLGFVGLAAVGAHANTMTFENTPSGGTPVDDGLITDPYSYSGGSVRFFFDANGNNRYDAGVDVLPAFEHVGDDGTNGFDSNFTGIPDTPRPGYAGQLGSWFLRNSSGNETGADTPLVAAYSTAAPIRALSGEIWDIDGRNGKTEQWRVDVLSDGGAVLASTLSPSFTDGSDDSLDSLPWTFRFEHLPDGVASVRLTFVGTKNSAGVAFNNFSPDVALPEPSSLWLVTSLAAVRSLRRRRATRE